MSDIAPVGEGGSTAAGQGASSLAAMETDSGTRVQTRNGQAAEARNCASVMKEKMFEDESKGCNICKVRYQSKGVEEDHLKSAQHRKNTAMKESNSQAEAVALSSQSVKPKQSPPRPERTSVIEDHEFFYYDQNGSGECNLCDPPVKYNSIGMSEIHLEGKPHKKNLEIRKAKARGLKLGPNGEIFDAFTNGNGQCYVCDVKYPSHDKKNEHIHGDRHKRKCAPLMSS